MARLKLLANLRELVGSGEIVVEGSSLEEVLRKAVDEHPSLLDVIDLISMQPKPGYIIFVDGIDIRLVDKNRKPREIVFLPVNHGGEVPEKIETEIVTWDEIEELTEKVKEKIVKSGFKPDVIVAIIRGGMIPARLLSDYLGVDDILTLEIKLYEGIGIRGRRPYLRQPLTGEVRGKRVLLVDDISDTGLTLQLAEEVVSFYMPDEIKTASLYIKPWTNFVTDYYAAVTDKWVVFPWEKREFQRLLKEENNIE